MIGISSYGAYIPIYRLTQKEIARAWGKRGRGGEKAICNSDEDSITMAVEAALDCIADTPREEVDALYFASTTSPYLEKQSASIIATACDLREDIVTIDFGNSIRASTNAFQAALNAVAAGTAKKVVVVASDCRIAPPNSLYEKMYGDGAAAFMISDSDVAVTITDTYSMTSEFMDVWRKPGDLYPQMWEDRFVSVEGIQKIFPNAIKMAIEKFGTSIKDFDKVIYFAPDSRAHGTLGNLLGLDAEKVQDPMFGVMGNTGTAFSPMMLVAALEQAKAGAKILWTNYSDGCDVYSLKVEDGISNITGRRGIQNHLESKMIIPDYGKYLLFRNLIQVEQRREPDHPTAITMMWRETNQLTRLHGCKCNNCGTIQYPIQRVCTHCQTKDDFAEIRLSDKKGALFTYSINERALAIDPPVVLCIVDLDGGGRFYSNITDRDPENIEVGTRLEMTFRKIHDAGGFHNYFWKVRQIRC